MTEDDPSVQRAVRLIKGGEAFGYPVASLRTEARKGRLVLLQIAGRDYVTAEAIREMENLCRIARKPALRLKRSE